MALIVDWAVIADAHIEQTAQHVDTNGTTTTRGTGICVDCGRTYPCGPARMAAQTLRDMELRASDPEVSR